ncbi:MAG: amidohydrolase family protein [Clostridia bacterium]|nr:amidohydrolase family protein [Clostridia bacterium]
MMFDCHMHMILDGVYYRAAIDAQKERPDDALIRARLQAYAAAGVTYLRDGGDAWGVGKRAAELAPEYGIEYRTPIFPIHRKGRYGGFIGCGFEDMKEYRTLVGKAKTAGADFIKIMISGLMDFDHYGVITSQPLDAGEIREMIRIAHGEGFAVMAHANGAETVKAAVEAGVDSIEHGAYLDDEAVKMIAESGAVWVPTLVTIGNLIGDGRYPDGVLKPLMALQLENVAKCAELGGKIALGSDNGAYRVPHVQGTMDEYKYLQMALGNKTDQILECGNKTVQSLFKRS